MSNFIIVGVRCSRNNRTLRGVDSYEKRQVTQTFLLVTPTPPLPTCKVCETTGACRLEPERSVGAPSRGTPTTLLSGVEGLQTRETTSSVGLPHPAVPSCRRDTLPSD